MKEFPLTVFKFEGGFGETLDAGCRWNLSDLDLVVSLPRKSLIFCDSVLGVSDSLIEFEGAGEHLERKKPSLETVSLGVP